VPNKQQAARVDRTIARWKPRLLLDSWSITVDFKDKDEFTGSDPTLATMMVHKQYQNAWLKIFPAFFREPTAGQEVTLIHELSHIITWGTRELLLTQKPVSESRSNAIIENLTETYAKILYKAYKPNRKPKAYHL
jgi:hypothetical protein